MAAAPHPLDPLAPEEITAARELLAAAGLVTEATRFAYLGLLDPPKNAPEAAGRRLRVLLLDTSGGPSSDATVSLTDARVVSHQLLDAAILHLEELKSRGVRFVPVSSEAVATLNQAPIKRTFAASANVGRADLPVGQDARQRVLTKFGATASRDIVQSPPASLISKPPEPIPVIAAPTLSPEAKAAAQRGMERPYAPPESHPQ